MNIKKTLMRAVVVTIVLLAGSQAFAARTTTYYHNDGLGSVVAATNEAGQVLWRKDYAPFGEQIDTTPDTERQSYTGKPHDDVTGLSYFGGRYYDPQVARFMSVDSVAFVDNNTMSFNRYLYVNNNPYKYVDPDGEFLNFALKFVLDVGINVAFNYVTTGELNVSGALKESALGVFNPMKTVAKAGSLAKVLAKSRKVENVAAKEMGFAAKASKPTGTYTNTHASGKKYHGKGSEKRMKQSAKERADQHNDAVVDSKHTPTSTSREAFKEEHRRIDADGGPGAGNYNEITSPGKKMLKEDGG